MKWIKILALLMLTLGAMRAASWTLGWVLTKAARLGAGPVAVLANAGGFLIFVLLLWRSSFPGETLDLSALAFGLLVFTVCGWCDRHWTPWRRRLQPPNRK